MRRYTLQLHDIKDKKREVTTMLADFLIRFEIKQGLIIELLLKVIRYLNDIS